MNQTLKYANSNIKLLLKFKGWTQETLCKKTGITPVTLRRRLNADKTTWSTTEALSIANAFGLDVQTLFFTKMVPNGITEEKGA